MHLSNAPSVAPVATPGNWPCRFSGKITRVVFYNGENGYSILKCHTKGGREVTVIGACPTRPVEAADFRVDAGRWVEDPLRGKQFRAIDIAVKAPSDLDVLAKYICETVKGIGERTAARIVEHFGQETEAALCDSAKLATVGGIKPEQAADFARQWNDLESDRATTLFLLNLGMGNALARRTINRFGSAAVEARVSTNPYALTEISGIGFKIADAAAASLGIARDSHERIKAGIVFALEARAGEGHTTTDHRTLSALAAKLLQLPKEVVEPVLAVVEYDDRRQVVVREGDDGGSLYALYWLDRAERRVAEAVLKLLSDKPPIPVPSAADIRADFGFTPDPEQVEAIKMALSKGLCVITGGPGCGKTTLVRVITSVFPGGVVLAAPTGKAAKRLAEATGIEEALTIHRLLEPKPDEQGFVFKRDEETPLELAGKILIVDECSMLDVKLAYSLFSAIVSGARVVLVGDANQLPSVGAGNLLADMIAAGVPTVTLKRIHRTGQGSPIPIAAASVIRGEVPTIGTEGDLRFLHADDNSVLLNAISELLAKGVPISDIQVLAPVWKGEFGADVLNTCVQRLSNQNHAKGGGILTGRNIPMNGDDGSAISVPERIFVGDRVMQIANNYDLNIFNGEQMLVSKHSEADKGDARWLDILVDIGNNAHVNERVASSGIADLKLSYASTIHKSQGSEFKHVFLALRRSHYIMLNRKLLYTAMTRARKSLTIVGEWGAIEMAVRDVGSVVQRETALKFHLGRLNLAA